MIESNHHEKLREANIIGTNHFLLVISPLFKATNKKICHLDKIFSHLFSPNSNNKHGKVTAKT